LARCAPELAKPLLLVWNTIGLIDIIFVVFSALQFGLKDWQSMQALRGTSTQSSPDISGTTYYRIARFDFRPAGASGNRFCSKD
jgi:hypothetical protein